MGTSRHSVSNSSNHNNGLSHTKAAAADPAADETLPNGRPPDAPVDNDPTSWTAEADFEALRLPSFVQSPTKPTTVLKTVPRAPRNQEWVRVRPGEAFRGVYGLLRDVSSGTLYAVVPALHDELADELRTYLLLTAVNTEGEVFLWPVPFGREPWPC